MGEKHCYLCDFDGKKLYNNVMVTNDPQGTAAVSQCMIYAFNGSNYKVLLDNNIPMDDYYDAKLIDDYNVLFYSKYLPKKYSVNIKSNSYVADKTGENSFYTINETGQGPIWKVKDVDNDGVDELDWVKCFDGTCHGDFIAEVNEYFKYDNSKCKWTLKDYSVNSDKYSTKKLSNSFQFNYKIKSKEQAIELIKSKTTINGNEQLQFNTEGIIPDLYSPPAEAKDKACYNFLLLDGTGECEECQYFVIESTGQVYKGSQGTWQVLN